MAVAYLYVVGASKDPDHVRCVVPWEVDDAEIFCGPCKKKLRSYLKARLLRDQDELVPDEDIFVVGLNALPSPKGPRKIVWAGSITRLMTFARAWEVLQGPRYQPMLDTKLSPLNVMPVRGAGGELLGYQFRPNGDHAVGWATDLLTTTAKVVRKKGQLLLRSGVRPHEAFARDLCFTAENLFFANGQGLAVDDALVKVLKASQPAVTGIDKVSVFGRHAGGAANGNRGGYLTVSKAALVNAVVDWIRAGARQRPPPKLAGGPTLRPCSPNARAARSPSSGGLRAPPLVARRMRRRGQVAGLGGAALSNPGRVARARRGVRNP